MKTPESRSSPRFGLALFTCLLLTLLATPVAYSLFDDLQTAAGRIYRRLRGLEPAQIAKARLEAPAPAGL